MALLGAVAWRPWRTARPGWPGRVVAFLFLVLGLAATPAPAAAAAPPVSREYQLKAVFLYNFVQFVEWPAAALPDASAPIRIGVLGEDPFGTALDAAVRGETVRARRLEVKRARRIEELRDCQVVFIARSEERHAAAHLAELAGRPVLTVGETDDFTRLGGIIAFYPEGKKIRFAINVGAARDRGLMISSELLELGKIVGDEPAPGGA